MHVSDRPCGNGAINKCSDGGETLYPFFSVSLEAAFAQDGKACSLVILRASTHRHTLLQCTMLPSSTRGEPSAVLAI